ncbi:ATP-binding protein [Nesterenkonia pannonica]|uniref:ATP-binding protein n=1 Tax=Nesterenkonia pannonica TaxID=1548602 RepID=UPI00216428A3|nr:ATP-binding protein [Nesterenkonia pannonica]
MLAAKLTEAAEQGVEITTVAQGQLLDFMEPLDLSALFGNALDNALRAASQVRAADQRLVRVGVMRRDGFAVISSENTFEGSIDIDGDLPRSTKHDRAEHGYGLRNIRQIAEDYGGVATFSAENGWFTLTAVLPLPGSGEHGSHSSVGGHQG